MIFSYVTQWSALIPQRVSSNWWSATLAPLNRLEAAATSNCDIKTSFISMTDAKQEQAAAACGDKSSNGLSSFSQTADRASLEDMELEIKAYTEPLPRNQQVEAHEITGLGYV
jgi:xeroderma pigmentosum group C-complementing protein